MPSNNPQESVNLVAHEVRSGRYFEDAKSWYFQKFIAVVWQRNWLLLLAIAGGFAAIVSVFALFSILPVVERKNIPISSPNIDEMVAESVKLERADGVSMDEGFLRFFVKEYVTRRESYDFFRAESNAAFVKAQSDPLAFQAYDALWGANNPQSLYNRLGKDSERVIKVRSVQLNLNVEPHVAVVQFTAEIRGKVNVAPAQWTASMGFYYDSLEIAEKKDPDTGELMLDIHDPVFNVVQYVVSQDSP